MRLRKRQRPEHDGVDDAEHRGVCGDADRQRQRTRGRETGRFAQLSNGKSQVGEEVLNPGPRPDVSRLFFNARDVPELAARLSDGVVSRNAARDELIDPFIEVPTDLL